MQLQTKEELQLKEKPSIKQSKINESLFSKDFVEYLSEAGWRLEKKLPLNNNNYSDLLEDIDWKSNYIDLKFSKHYRRDLDALS